MPGVLVAELSVSVLFVHTGLLLEAVGVTGVWFTTTFTEAAADVQPAIVTVTEYKPLFATVARGITGFCKPLVKPGPFHK